MRVLCYISVPFLDFLREADGQRRYTFFVLFCLYIRPLPLAFLFVGYFPHSCMACHTVYCQVHALVWLGQINLIYSLFGTRQFLPAGGDGNVLSRTSSPQANSVGGEITRRPHISSFLAVRLLAFASTAVRKQPLMLRERFCDEASALCTHLHSHKQVIAACLCLTRTVTFPDSILCASHRRNRLVSCPLDCESGHFL